MPTADGKHRGESACVRPGPQSAFCFKPTVPCADQEYSAENVAAGGNAQITPAGKNRSLHARCLVEKIAPGRRDNCGKIPDRAARGDSHIASPERPNVLAELAEPWPPRRVGPSPSRYAGGREGPLPVQPVGEDLVGGSASDVPTGRDPDIASSTGKYDACGRGVERTQGRVVRGIGHASGINYRSRRIRADCIDA